MMPAIYRSTTGCTGLEGGGRNIGEACHVYDVFEELTGLATVKKVTAVSIAPSNRLAKNDNFSATIGYERRICLHAHVHRARGKEHPKERMEVYADGRVLTLDDYRALSASDRSSPLWSSRTVDKGDRQAAGSWLVQCLPPLPARGRSRSPSSCARRRSASTSRCSCERAAARPAVRCPRQRLVTFGSRARRALRKPPRELARRDLQRGFRRARASARP